MTLGSGPYVLILDSKGNAQPQALSPHGSNVPFRTQPGVCLHGTPKSQPRRSWSMGCIDGMTRVDRTVFARVFAVKQRSEIHVEASQTIWFRARRSAFAGPKINPGTGIARQLIPS